MGGRQGKGLVVSWMHATLLDLNGRVKMQGCCFGVTSPCLPKLLAFLRQQLHISSVCVCSLQCMTCAAYDHAHRQTHVSTCVTHALLHNTHTCLLHSATH